MTSDSVVVFVSSSNLDVKHYLDMLADELKSLSLGQTDFMRAISLLQSYISDNMIAQSATDDVKSSFLDGYIIRLRASHAKIKVLKDLLDFTQVLIDKIIFP